MDVEVAYNVFFSSTHAYGYHHFALPDTYKQHHNTVHLGSGKKVVYQQPETIERALDWRARTAREAGSEFYVIPDDVDVAGSILADLASKAAYAIAKHAPQDLSELDSSSSEARDSSSIVRIPSAGVGGRFVKVAKYTVSGTNASVMSQIQLSSSRLAQNRPLIATLDVRVSGPAHLSQPQMSVVSFGTLETGPIAGQWSASDFVLILTSANTTSHNYTFELWLKMTNLYSAISLRPLMVERASGDFTFFRKHTPVTSLPSGTQTSGTKVT